MPSGPKNKKRRLPAYVTPSPGPFPRGRGASRCAPRGRRLLGVPWMWLIVNDLVKTGCLKNRNPFCSIALSTVIYWERLPQQGLGMAAIPCRSPHPRHPSTESAFLVSARAKTVFQTRSQPSRCLAWQRSISWALYARSRCAPIFATGPSFLLYL